MLLRQLKLNNIRSYTNQTINFQEGTTLLSGDIGSGKSSVLLAIEFALFGTAQPDLPGESLLRKGESTASVELTFSIDSQEITILRNLKKDKRGIKQLPGSIMINEVKKDLMPVELKAHVISLLGYPEDVISKNKNFIFRYTIYTPQEEMKLIVQENAELRLDTLRKIFNIDKYKNIRENLQLYLRGMRTKLAILKTKLEPLEPAKEKEKTILLEEKNLQEEIEKLEPQVHVSKETRKQEEVKLHQLEQKHKLFLEVQREIKTTVTLLEEKQKRLTQLRGKKDDLQKQVTDFTLPENTTLQTVKEQLQQVEETKASFLSAKGRLQQELAQIQQQITLVSNEISTLSTDLASLGEKEQQIQECEKQLAEREQVQEKHQHLQVLFEQTSGLMTKNQTILAQSEDVRKTIQDLHNCPVCLQKVSSDHKRTVLLKEGKKIEQAENLLAEATKKHSEIFQQKEQVKDKLTNLQQLDKLHAATIQEVIHLQSKKGLFEEKQKQSRLLVQRNNALMDQLKEYHGEKEEEIKVKQGTLVELLRLLEKKSGLEQQQATIIQEITVEEQGISQQRKGLAVNEQKLGNLQDLSEKILKQKDQISLCTEQEKNFAVQLARVQTNLRGVQQQRTEIQQVIGNLTALQQELVQKREAHHWLDKHLIPLTLTIEKHVMISIHSMFNQLFQEWFSILLEDEHMYARIDDSFTPVVEQNGYEIQFSDLSGGEKTSASLAYRLALNRVINDIVHRIKTKQLLILDEPTDGFSSEQLDKVRDVLDRLNLQQTILVSHETKIESFVQNIIRVSKQDTESKIY